MYGHVANIRTLAPAAVRRVGSIKLHPQQIVFDAINRGKKGPIAVLKYLLHKNEEITPTQISDAKTRSTESVSAHLRALEQKGQITRRIDKADRRIILVDITGKGKERVQEELGQLRKSLGSVFAAMGDKDTADFLRLTTLFSDLMHQYIK